MRAWADRARRLLAVFCLLELLPVTARAELFHSAADQPAARAMAGDVRGSLLSITAGGVFEPNNEFASAFLLPGDWVLTAGHVLDQMTAGQVLTVGTGDNYFTDRGEVATIDNSSVTFFPGWTRGHQEFPDLALAHLTTSLTTGRPVTFGTAEVGDILNLYGFSGFFTNETRGGLRDGFSYGGHAPLRSGVGVSNPFNDAYYNRTLFSDTLDLSLNMVGTSGDSGGLVTNSRGEAVGVMTHASSGLGEFGYTYYVDLTNTDVRSWITTSTAVPEPSTIVLVAVGAAVLGLREHRRRRLARFSIGSTPGAVDGPV